MTSLATIALQFTVSAIIIVAAGTVLARSGDVIAARSSLGRAWFGSVFLALATSLPELVTDIAAVRMGAPDLAVGDLFGSGLANMLILAIITLAPGGGDMFRRATLDHVLYASVAMVLTAIAAIVLLIRPATTWLGVGIGSWVLLAVYGFASRATFQHSQVVREAGTAIEMSEPLGAGTSPIIVSGEAPTVSSSRRALLTFAGAALGILIVAPQFARSAESLAVISGVGTTVVGTCLLGLSTSLPELVTSLAAVRLRAYDLAVGNLFGSNAINMIMFPALDMANGGRAVLSIADPSHVITALFVLILMGMATATLVFRTRRIGWIAEPGALLVLCGYLLAIAVLLGAQPR
ncbi:MAG: hypothetical protein RLZZ621_2372 [Gemmatimonadota bacterium]|jgi:cation:H+ antiporter